MYLFGCLPLLVIILGIAAIGLVVKGIERLGAVAVWLYDSFLNIFRSEKVQTINPFTGESNFEREPDQHDDISFIPTEERPKRYTSSDGEYVDYQDVN